MKSIRVAFFTALALALVMACLVAAAAGGQVPGVRPGGDNPFAGRWEIRVLAPPDQLNEFEEDGAPFVIIDIAGPRSSLSGTLVASLAPPGMEMKLVAVSAKGDQLLLVLEGVENGKPVPFKLEFKRIADRLEGTGVFPDGAKEIDMACVGVRTTRGTVAPPAKLPPAADRQAYAAAP